MMRAIVDELGSTYPLATEPWIAPYQDRARLGLLQKLRIRHLGPAASWPADLMPRRFRSLFGIVREQEIGAVLDVSGFRYSDDDPWGARSANELDQNTRRWAKRGTRVILMPQAFGPFLKPEIARPFARAAARCVLIYARDGESHAHLQRLLGADPRVRLAPDFTIPLAGQLPADLGERTGARPFACVVPNDRMVEGKDRAGSEAYLIFLSSILEMIKARGLLPLLLLHETKRDAAIAERLASGVPGTLVLPESDPLRLKGILGAAQLVVASRFHALVGALAQGVPALATGWSHKYAGLLADFGCPEAMVNVGDGADDLSAKVDALLSPASREPLIARLRENAQRLGLQVDRMWLDVREALEHAGS
jgi:colanic acid/amylovoran biosynthesis protein